MRENMGLYRGKRTYNGEWVEGALVVWPDGVTWILAYNPTEDWMDRYEVDSPTVGQFTGLTDKNGRRIFEGDVVEHDGKRFAIEFIGRYARFASVRPNTVFAVFNYSTAEVIGNIHDNPELKGES